MNCFIYPILIIRYYILGQFVKNVFTIFLNLYKHDFEAESK
jgi:hypothetical protein